MAMAVGRDRDSGVPSARRTSSRYVRRRAPALVRVSSATCRPPRMTASCFTAAISTLLPVVADGETCVELIEHAHQTPDLESFGVPLLKVDDPLPRNACSLGKIRLGEASLQAQASDGSPEPGQRSCVEHSVRGHLCHGTLTLQPRQHIVTWLQCQRTVTPSRPLGSDLARQRQQRPVRPGRSYEARARRQALRCGDRHRDGRQPADPRDAGQQHRCLARGLGLLRAGRQQSPSTAARAPGPPAAPESAPLPARRRPGPPPRPPHRWRAPARTARAPPARACPSGLRASRRGRPSASGRLEGLERGEPGRLGRPVDRPRAGSACELPDGVAHLRRGQGEEGVARHDGGRVRSAPPCRRGAARRPPGPGWRRRGSASRPCRTTARAAAGRRRTPRRASGGPPTAPGRRRVPARTRRCRSRARCSPGPRPGAAVAGPDVEPPLMRPGARGLGGVP